MRALRHSPTTMPIRLIRTTLLSRWLCMPPSIHWSNSERGEVLLAFHSYDHIIHRDSVMKRSHFTLTDGLLSDLKHQMLLFVPERSSWSSESFSRLTLSSKALLTYSCCSRGVCFTALGLAQAWDTDRNTWEHTQQGQSMPNPIAQLWAYFYVRKRALFTNTWQQTFPPFFTHPPPTAYNYFLQNNTQ